MYLSPRGKGIKDASRGNDESYINGDLYHANLAAPMDLKLW